MKTSQRQADLQHVMHMRLFQNVAASNLSQLLKGIRACELEAGEILLSPFKRNQYLYLLLAGLLYAWPGSAGAIWPLVALSVLAGSVLEYRQAH